MNAPPVPLGPGGGYAVDLDTMADTVVELGRCRTEFDVLLGDLARRVAALHLTWTGEAAIAHAAAQAAWERGFAGMNEGLGAMQGAADVAHANYSAALDANLRIWRSS